MSDFLANYHTHTWRCSHATGTEEEYVQAAIQSGLKVLGFADHTPWRYNSSFVSRIRMRPDQLEDYVLTLRALREKYADRIRLYIGLEAEYFPDYLPWLLEEKERWGLDYLIFGNHYHLTDDAAYPGRCYYGSTHSPDDVKRYTETALAGMESGHYRYLAHPDLFLRSYPAIDNTCIDSMAAICRRAKELNLPLEYNLAGLAVYPIEAKPRGFVGYTSQLFLDTCVQEGNTLICGCDAHQVQEMQGHDEFDLTAQKAKLRALGLTVLDTLPGLE